MTNLPSRYGREKSESAVQDQASRMITLVSHELKNPLSAIQLTAEMLSKYREQISVADQEKHLMSLVNNTQMLKDLIDKTITYYRLNYNVLNPDLHTVEINDFLKNMQIEASEWPDCHHPLYFYPKTSSVNLDIDSYQMKSVLESLLKNAMHFSEPGTPILMEWNLHNQKVEIAVIDQGVGIPEEDMPHIFDPFFRTRDLAGNTGTGLSLTISKQIACKHNGDIYISKNIPKGTIVKIILPLQVV
jgi:signal transduction histidine kinase